MVSPFYYWNLHTQTFLVAISFFKNSEMILVNFTYKMNYIRFFFINDEIFNLTSNFYQLLLSSTI